MAKTDLTFSMIRSYQTCPRKCYWQYIQAIETIKKAEALDIGTLFHQLIEWYELGISPEEQQPLTEYDEEKLMKASCMATAYINELGSKMESEYRYINTEHEFTMPIYNDEGNITRNFNLAGKVDAVVEDIKGKRWLIEHKTASIVDGDYIDKLSLDMQISIYMMAYRHESPETAPVGVIYNVVQKCPLRRLQANKRREKPETLEEYRTRITQWYIDNPSAVSQFNIHFTDNDINDVRSDVWMWADDINRSMRSAQWQRNTSACHGIYGKCAFLPLCMGNMHDASMYIGTYYQYKGEMHSELRKGNDVNTIDDFNDIDNMRF